MTMLIKVALECNRHLIRPAYVNFIARNNKNVSEHVAIVIEISHHNLQIKTKDQMGPTVDISKLILECQQKPSQISFITYILFKNIITLTLSLNENSPNQYK